jgi:hypothetical protein
VPRREERNMREIKVVYGGSEEECRHDMLTATL